MNIRDLHDLHDDGQPPSADILAGEYVLGVLDAAQRSEAEQRIANDPGFARLVSQWENRLAPMLDALGSEAVPAHVWPRIRTALGWPSVGAGAPRAWQRTGFWQGMTALAAVVALVAVFSRGQLEPVARLHRRWRSPRPRRPPRPNPSRRPSRSPRCCTTTARQAGWPRWTRPRARC